VRITLLSAATGDFEPPPPPPPEEGVTLYVERRGIGDDHRLSARYVKTHTYAHESDVTVWMDSRFRLTAPVSQIVRDALSTGALVVAMRHPDRDNIRDEADAIHARGLMTRESLDAQLDRYGDFGQTDLTATGLMVRVNTPSVRRFCRLWWHEIRTHGIRDQMSVDYCAHVAGLRIGYLPGSYRDNPYAVWSKT